MSFSVNALLVFCDRNSGVSHGNIYVITDEYGVEALYAFFIMQKKNCSKCVESCDNCNECFIDIQSVFEKQAEITDIYRKICSARPLNEIKNGGIIKLDNHNFMMYKSRIKENLRDRYGLYALKDLEIASIGSRPNTRYGIRMDK